MDLFLAVFKLKRKWSKTPIWRKNEKDHRPRNESLSTGWDTEVGFDIKPHHTGKDLRKKPELRNKELNLLGQGQRAGEQEGKD